MGSHQFSGHIYLKRKQILERMQWKSFSLSEVVSCVMENVGPGTDEEIGLESS